MNIYHIKGSGCAKNTCSTPLDYIYQPGLLTQVRSGKWSNPGDAKVQSSFCRLHQESRNNKARDGCPVLFWKSAPIVGSNSWTWFWEKVFCFCSPAFMFGVLRYFAGLNLAIALSSTRHYHYRAVAYWILFHWSLFFILKLLKLLILICILLLPHDWPHNWLHWW